MKMHESCVKSAGSPGVASDKAPSTTAFLGSASNGGAEISENINWKLVSRLFAFAIPPNYSAKSYLVTFMLVNHKQ